MLKFLLLTFQACLNTEFIIPNGSCVICPNQTQQHPTNESLCDCGQQATFQAVEMNYTTNGSILDPPKNITVIVGQCTPCPTGEENANQSNVCSPIQINIPICKYFFRLNNLTNTCELDSLGVQIAGSCFGASFFITFVTLITTGVVLNKRAGLGTKYKRRHARWSPGKPINLTTTVQFNRRESKTPDKSETEKQRIRRENKELKEQVKREKREQNERKKEESIERKRQIIAARREQRTSGKSKNDDGTAQQENEKK